MSIIPKSIKSIFLLDALLYLCGAVGIYLISLKTDLPFQTTFNESIITINKLSDGSTYNLEGQRIRSINGYVFRSPEETETYLDGLGVGDKIKLVIDNQNVVEVKLVNYYSTVYLLLSWLIGSSFFAIAIIVLLKARAEKPARVFHWVCICTALILMITWGFYNVHPKPLGFIVRSLLHMSVSLVPALFIHFTLVFPREKKIKTKLVHYLLYSLSAIIFVVLSYNFLSLIYETSLQNIQAYVRGYNVSRIFLIICVVISIIIFAHSYVTALSESDRKKLKWILYGLTVGPLSFILLWTIPIILMGKSLVPEELVMVLISIIPITFAISIVKYHVMDIDYLINRSFVYSIVIGSLLALYMLIIGLLTNFAFPAEAKISAIISALVIVLLFQPIRNKVQAFVDKKFFRVRYNFREAIKNIFTEINESNDVQSLADKIVEGIDELIPVEKVGFFALNPVNNKLKLIAQKNFDLLINRSVIFYPDKLKTNLSLPIALVDKVEPGVQVETADVEVFKRWGMNLVFTIKSSEGVIHGFIVLGAKKSGTKFTVEDIDLLNAVVGRVAASIDRIKLQEELILERIESERLDELNRMKSYFISSVSHDMKTPLTSIKMFAELLQSSSEIQSEKSKEYLEIIDGESSRLSRLIDNVLDFSKIERGVKQYRFEPAYLNNIVEQTLKLMDYQFKLQNFFVESNLTQDEKTVYADKDAVEEAFINLLSNSLKYSRENKVIRISTFIKNEFMSLAVEDDGIGISKYDMDNIFNPFFRIDSEEVHRTGGAGLGLSIVKHIMDAHKGKIEVQSEPGKGSRFVLLFPAEKL